MAIPSLYRFFADRDEILDALLEHMTADLDQHAWLGGIALTAFAERWIQA